VDLSEARIKSGDPRAALVSLQQALAEKKDVRVIALLGAAVQAIGQTPKARQLWLQAARMYDEGDDGEGRARALRAALVCSGGSDDAIEAELREVDETLARMSLRLDAQDWARPSSEREVEVVVRARVQAEYGFPDRARTTLEGATDIRTTTSSRAMMVEVLSMLDETDAAIAELVALRPASPSGRGQVATRLAFLRGETPPEPGAAAEELLDDDTFFDDDALLDDDDFLDDDDDLLDDDEPTAPPSAAPGRSGEDAEARGDRLAETGDLAGAVAAYREAMAADPSSEQLLFKLGDVMAQLDDDDDEPASEPAGGFSFSDNTYAEVSPDDMDEPGFGGGFSDGFDDGFDDGFGAAPGGAPAERPVDPQLAEARARISVGMFREAAPFLRGRTDLPAQVLIARIWLEVGDLLKARNILRSAVGQSDKRGEDYLEALWTLVDLYTRAKKPDAALHMIEELESAGPKWRRFIVQDRRHGLEVMLGKR
ncbi:MAG: tetratricopeptide (TPR) repeat protein, partial [Myxococcota bacterium]